MKTNQGSSQDSDKVSQPPIIYRHRANYLKRQINSMHRTPGIGLIDYEKAFDSVENSDLFLALTKIGIIEGYTQMPQQESI